MRIDAQGEKKVISNVNDQQGLIDAGYYADKDWNEYHIICQGNHVTHYLNGFQTMELIDDDRVTNPDDPADRKGSIREGILALQIHAGPPMLVEFKDILKMRPRARWRFRCNGRDYSFSRQALLETREFNTGVFIYRSGPLRKHLYEIGTDNVQGEVYLTDLIRMFVDGGLSVVGHVAEDNAVSLGFNNKTVLKQTGHWRYKAERVSGDRTFVVSQRGFKSEVNAFQEAQEMVNTLWAHFDLGNEEIV